MNRGDETAAAGRPRAGAEETDGTHLDRVPLVIGVTGHRDLVEAEIPALRERVRGLLAELPGRYPDLPLVVMSPLAEGADRLVAEEAVALGVRLVVPTPFPLEIYERDFDTPGALGDFRRLCAGAEIVELPLMPGETPASVARPGAARDRHYARLGIYLCAHCHVLLALWDGKTSDQTGGTAQVVRFHHWDVMPGFGDRSESVPQILAEDESDLVYHVVCSRDRPDGAPAAGLAPLEGWWFTTDADRPRTTELPEAYDRIFRRTAEFNQDLVRHRTGIRLSGWHLVTSATPPAVARVTAPVDILFRGADWLAVHFQRKVTLALRQIYTLAVLMGLAFIAYNDIGGMDFMIYVFLVLFAGGFLVHRLAERGAWHRKYLDYRALAEGLRVQFYWVAAGVTAGRATKFAHDNFLQKQDVELGWIRNVMRHTGRLADVTPLSSEGLDWAIHEWIGEPETGSGQLAYYQRKVVERSRLSRRTALVGTVCLWAGIGVTMVLALFAGRLSRGWFELMIVLMGILPLIAAVREAYAQKRAEKELIKQYAFMARIFANARRRLADAATDAERRRILKALGDAALEEHAEWILIHRERPLEHGGL